MYPKELEELLKTYLVDGIISAKEREILLKKALQFNVDPDEFNLYIDALQYKADSETERTDAKKRGNTCPFCGGAVAQLADKCPHCDEIITAKASEELTQILENLEEALVNFKSEKNIEESKAIVERYVRKANVYYGNNPNVQKLLIAIETESAKAYKKHNRDKKKESFVVIIIILFWVLPGLIYFLVPSPKEDPQDCIKAVGKALKEGDIMKAEAIYAGYCQNAADSVGRSPEDVQAARDAIDEAKGVVKSQNNN